MINVKGKSIGIYFTKESLQTLSKMKRPDETLSNTINRIIEDCTLSAHTKITENLLKKFIVAFNEYKRTGAVPSFEISEDEMTIYKKLGE